MADARLFLIDAHALCYRSFFAIKELSTGKGQRTNAIFGFVNTLRKILQDYQPEYMAVCFDSPGKTHRQAKFNDYKIQRPTMPKDLIDQMPIIKDVVRAYGLAMFESAGFEADDIIATITRRTARDPLEVVIVSEDKDMYQLAGEKVMFFSARQGGLCGYEKLKERLGFDPRHTADFIGLSGDQSDNIPGVFGIGEVTARKLINRYGTLEAAMDHIEEIEPEKLREKLRSHKDTAVLSKSLAVLDQDVPIDCDLDQLKIKAPDNPALFTLFTDLEFNKFAREFASRQNMTETPQACLIETPKDMDALTQAVKQKGSFAFLLDSPASPKAGEARQGRPAEGAVAVKNRHVMISVGEDMIFSVGSDHWNCLQPLFRDRTILKITHNLKESVKILSEQDCHWEGKIFDVMLAGYLLGMPQNALSVGALAWDYFKESLPEDDALALQAGVIFRLYPVMSAQIKEKTLDDLLERIEIPLSFVLSEMEDCGVRLDLELLERLSKECGRKMEDLTVRLYAAAGEEFNLNSPKQLSHILFEKLKLPVIKKTKTGFSTDEEVLTILAQNHDFPSLILEYRQLSKLKSTYIDALPAMVDPGTGRIHAQFNQTGTETGRLSSSQPNLQNIPIRTELGRQIRKAFVPLTVGHHLVSADYSQIELRILAHLSQDQDLIRAFEEGEDIHRLTASLIFDVPEKEVTAPMRDSAKRVNFGIIYGMSAFGLAKDLGISQTEAQDFIDRYFLKYPGVKRFIDHTIRECETRGFVTTLLNRRRYIPEITSPNNSMRQFAQRQAINTPVQGSAADLIKLAMIDIHKEIRERKMSSRMLITVHDELVFDVPPGEKNDLINLVRDRMEHSLELSVPIKVSVKTGADWLDMREE